MNGISEINQLSDDILMTSTCIFIKKNLNDHSFH